MHRFQISMKSQSEVGKFMLIIRSAGSFHRFRSSSGENTSMSRISHGTPSCIANIHKPKCKPRARKHAASSVKKNCMLYPVLALMSKRKNSTSRDRAMNFAWARSAAVILMLSIPSMRTSMEGSSTRSFSSLNDVWRIAMLSRFKFLQLLTVFMSISTSSSSHKVSKIEKNMHSDRWCAWRRLICLTFCTAIPSKKRDPCSINNGNTERSTNSKSFTLVGIHLMFICTNFSDNGQDSTNAISRIEKMDTSESASGKKNPVSPWS